MFWALINLFGGRTLVAPGVLLEMAGVVRCQVIVTCQSCRIPQNSTGTRILKGFSDCFQQKKGLLKGPRQSSRHHSCQNLPLHVYVNNNIRYTRCLFLAIFGLGPFELPLTPQNYLSEPALNFQAIGNMRLSSAHPDVTTARHLSHTQ